VAPGGVGSRKTDACTAAFIAILCADIPSLRVGTLLGAIVRNKTSARPPPERHKCAQEETRWRETALELKRIQVREVLERRCQGRAALDLQVVVAASGGGEGGAERRDVFLCVCARRVDFTHARVGVFVEEG
jgi:hypothetical protein